MLLRRDHALIKLTFALPDREEFSGWKVNNPVFARLLNICMATPWIVYDVKANKGILSVQWRELRPCNESESARSVCPMISLPLHFCRKVLTGIFAATLMLLTEMESGANRSQPAERISHFRIYRPVESKEDYHSGKWGMEATKRASAPRERPGRRWRKGGASDRIARQIGIQSRQSTSKWI